MSAGTDISKMDKAFQLNPIVIMSETGYPRREHEETLYYLVSMSYAQFYGKWLPTEAEWEKAARRGLAGKKYPYGLGNSTIMQERPAEIEHEIEALFIGAKEEIFEDGMESEFSKGLISMIRRYGNFAIEVIAKLILYEEANPEVASESLRWLGHINHDPTYTYRLWLLEQSLRCSSVRVRDGAALGLAFLDDPRAVPYLKQAIQREQCEELREDMKQVLEQLLENER